MALLPYGRQPLSSYSGAAALPTGKKTVQAGASGAPVMGDGGTTWNDPEKATPGGMTEDGYPREDPSQTPTMGSGDEATVSGAPDNTGKGPTPENWGSNGGDWMWGSGGVADTAKGAVVDLFSQDNAYSPDVTGEMWKYPGRATDAMAGATYDYEQAAYERAQGISGVGIAMGNGMATAGQNASGVIQDAAAPSTGIGVLASDAQNGLAGDAAYAGQSAFAEAQKSPYSIQAGAKQGMWDADTILGQEGSVRGATEDIQDADVTSGLNSAAGKTTAAIRDQDTQAADNLARWSPGMSTASAAATQAAGKLGGYQTSSAGSNRLAKLGASAAGTDALAGFQVDRSGQTGLLNYNPESSRLGQLGSASIGNNGVGAAAQGGTSGLSSLGDRLTNYQGPSEAELQMSAALDKNVSAQFALANSGRGAYNGQAMRRAQATAASLGQETAAGQAQLRAKEEASRLQLAADTYGSLGQLGNAQDTFLQQNDALRLQQLQAGAEGEAVRSQLALSGLQSGAEIGVANSRLGLDAATNFASATNANDRVNLDAASAYADSLGQQDQLRLTAAGDYASATLANDQTRLAAISLDLQGKIAAAEAAGQNTSNLVALLNANTAAQQAASGASLEQLGMAAQYSAAGDTNDINRATAMAGVSEGLMGADLAAYQAEVAADQGWYGIGTDAQRAASGMYATGYGQQLEGQGQYLDSVTNAEQMELDAALQGMVQNLGAQITAAGMIVDAQGTVLGSVQEWYQAEAARRAGLEATSMQAEAAVSTANAEIDMARDSSTTSMISGAAGAAAFF